MTVREQLEQRLLEQLQPERMNLENESHRHSVPPGSESHWNLVVVSPIFENRSLLQRQRTVYGAVGDLMQRIHALTMKTLTPAEWEAAGGDVANPAPPCMGGSKRDKPSQA